MSARYQPLKPRTYRRHPPTDPASVPAWLRTRAHTVVMALGMDWTALCGPGRAVETVRHREVLWTILHEWPSPCGAPVSYPQIAAACGHANHSSVIGGVSRLASGHTGANEQDRATVRAFLAPYREELIRAELGRLRMRMFELEEELKRLPAPVAIKLAS